MPTNQEMKAEQMKVAFERCKRSADVLAEAAARASAEEGVFFESEANETTAARHLSKIVVWYQANRR